MPSRRQPGDGGRGSVPASAAAALAPARGVAVAAGGGGQQRKLWLAVGALSLVLIALLVGLALWVRPGLLGNTKPELQKQPTLSLSEFLAGSSQDWRVARLQENTAVLVVEFPNLAAQGAAMNRMAALLEKADAPRDRVLDDAALAALIARNGDNSQTFYQGHDYDGIGLSRFYALVDKQSQALTGEEARIRHVLVEHGLLTESPEGVRPVGAQAVITFTAIQKDDPATPVDETIDERRRESVLRHEISHGRFYTRPAYREHCRRFWRETLTEPQREGFRRYLATLGYDRHDDELMLNEAQAFLLHTPDTRAFNAQGVGIPEEVLAELRTRFWRTLPAEARENDVDAGAAAVKPAGPAAPAATSRP